MEFSSHHFVSSSLEFARRWTSLYLEERASLRDVPALQDLRGSESRVPLVNSLVEYLISDIISLVFELRSGFDPVSSVDGSHSRS